MRLRKARALRPKGHKSQRYSGILHTVFPLCGDRGFKWTRTAARGLRSAGPDKSKWKRNSLVLSKRLQATLALASKAEELLQRYGLTAKDIEEAVGAVVKRKQYT